MSIFNRVMKQAKFDKWKNKYANLPKEVRENDHLYYTEKILFHEISSICSSSKKGVCYLDNIILGRVLRLSDIIIKNTLNKLRDKNLISVFYERNGSSEMRAIYLNSEGMESIFKG